MTQIFRLRSNQSPIRWTWLTLSGPDSRDFLHRLTTVNVQNLEEGRGAPGFFLAPSGKIRVYFTLWNEGPNRYGFELDGGSSGKWEQELLTVIDQYTFAEKLTLRHPSEDLSCNWIFVESPEELSIWNEEGLEPGKTSLLEEGIRVCHQGSEDYGKTWLTVWGSSLQLESWIESKVMESERTSGKTEEVSFQEIENWRIQALGPRVDAEITQNALPLEIGLLRGIAENKGCYPGQEVIEKIIALGAPARRLVRIDGKGTLPTIGTSILNLGEPTVEIGQVTSVAPLVVSSTTPQSVESAEFRALGWVKKIHAKIGLEVQFAGVLNSKGEVHQISTS